MKDDRRSKPSLAKRILGGRARGSPIASPSPRFHKGGEEPGAGEEFFRMLVENVDDIIAVINADGTARYLNPSNERYSGYTDGELLGQSPLGFIHPDDKEMVTTALSRLIENPGSTVEAEYRIRHRDGSWVRVEAVGRNLLERPGINAIIISARPVNEARKMEQALWEEKRFVENVLNSLHDIFYVLGPDAKLLRWNRALREVSGYDDDELASMSVYDFYDVEEQRRQDEFYRLLLEKGQAGIEAVAVTKDGRRIPYYFYSTLLRNGQGELLAVCGVGRDISELAKSREEILKFKTIADNANYGVALSDLDGGLLYINEYFASAHGYTTEELRGVDLAVFHNEGQMNMVEECIEELIEKGSFGPVEIWHTRREGSVFPMLMNGVLIKNGGGEPQFMATTAIDITERKLWEEALLESEERYRDLFENANDLIQSITPEGRFVYVNRSWLETLGYEREEIGSLKIQDIIHPDSMDHCMETFDRVMGGEKVTDIEAKFVTKSGEEIVVEGSASCRFDEGRPMSTRGIFRNVTMRKMAEEQLENYREHLEELVESRTLEIIHANERLQEEIAEKVKAEEELKASNLELDAFAHTVSHDLRGSLALIRGFAQTAMQAQLKWTTEELRECLEHIVEVAQRMNDFISAILAYSSAGHAEAEKGIAETRDVLRNVLDEYEGEIERLGVALTIPVDLPAVRADPAKVYQVLSNLVGNALKFMGRKQEPAVNITCGARSGQIVFCVSDNGMGIPKSEQESIFEPFKRCGQPGYPGLGIGLSTVRRAVEGWGGEVWVESEPGEGASFYFTVPAAEA